MESAPKPKKARRKNGCTSPIPIIVVATWVVHVALIAAYVGVIGVAVFRALERLPELIALVAIYVVFVTIFVSSYVYTQSVDPVDPSKACCTLPLAGRHNLQEKRYCPVCKKSVPGLDHHCKWLGTCVGRRNYLSFYLLAGFGLFTFLFQAGSIIALMIAQFPEVLLPTDDGVLFAFGIIVLVASALVGARYFVLFSYHTYLIYVGLGTYDYMLNQRNIEMAKRKAKEKQDAEQQA